METLASHFIAVAHKILTAADLPEGDSHQHEMHGGTAWLEFFGREEKVRGAIQWRYFGDDSAVVSDEDGFTFYDARARSAERTGRSEWRLYYEGEFLSCASPGDLLVVVKTRAGRYAGLVFARDSGWHRAALELFPPPAKDGRLSALNGSALEKEAVPVLRRRILKALDLEEAPGTQSSDTALMVAKFGNSFPGTRVLSDFARSQSDTETKDPDGLLMAWLEREEALFRALEAAIIGSQVKRGFPTVDEFLRFSLSVQNRRKSRMGQALQNHLEEIFRREGIRTTPQGRTENRNRPDFLFPGDEEYRDPAFPSARLSMLGVKSTSKDRWRQVLTEADRVPDKHLLTLETGISNAQTDEMHRHGLTLVVPAQLQATYSPAQSAWIMSLAEFISLARRRQKA